MTPRELVRKTLEFASPARTPRQLWLLPWATIHFPEEVARIQRRFPDDLIPSPPFYLLPLWTSGDEYGVGTYVDEWGCRFENRQRGVIGEVKEPLLRDWGDLDLVRPPLERLSVDRARVGEFCRSRDEFVLSKWCGRPFEQLQFIRGPESLYLDLAERPAGLDRLLGRLHQFYCEETEVWARTAVDALVFSDDWGGQHSLLIAPALWREMFKPLYRDYIEIAHRHGKFAFMHSDGFILDIVPDLIELGLDALNSQLFCMDIEELGRRSAGRITFWGEIDRQQLLSFGTPQQVSLAVARVRKALARSGGVIAQCEFGVGARPENVAAVFAAWEEERAFLL